jgi:hypothetical protein
MCPEFADFHTRNRDAKEASKRVEEFLHSCIRVVDVENVEDDKEYQARDIDLLCTLEVGDDRKTVAIEVKGDTKAHQTGNFFFETISNEALGTQGCFLKSEADLLFYYLLETDRLYIFPLKRLQAWFVEMQKRLTSSSRLRSIFRLKKTHTIDTSGNYQHTTVGSCVKIEYTKRCLKEENIHFREIERMSEWRCTLTDFCLEQIQFTGERRAL